MNALIHRQSYPTMHDRPKPNQSVKYKRFSKFDDRDGYAGYVPSTEYLQLVYTALLDQLRPLMDKELAILGGVILKGDHSFKIPNHMAKLGGSSAFTALYTLCNEYEEIRLQLLVPTKSPTHLEKPLKDMVASYNLYNHKQVELFFTDNVKGDHSVLERSIPSLERDMPTSPTPQSDNSHHIPQHTRYLDLPPTVNVEIIQSSAQACDAVQQIRNHLTHPTRELVVGFDCEWNFDRIHKVSSKVSLVQVACLDDVWLFRVDSSGGVPRALAQLINDPDVLKVGRNVTGDLKKLNRDYGIEWKGALELGSFCRRRGAIERGTLGLSDISAIVLGGHLRKDSNTRLSSWEQPVLREDQRTYAALDAWASLKIFDTVKDYDMYGKQLPTTVPSGFPCSLQYAGTAVAFGHFYEAIEGARDAIFIVTRIGVPGAIVTIDGQQATKALSDCGNLPFAIQTPIYQLRTEKPSLCNPVQTVSMQPCDQQQQVGERMDMNQEQPQQSRHPRILKDVFHLMDMIKIPKTHGLAKEFMRRFRDALFVVNEEDKKRIERHLQTTGLTWNYMLVKNPAWVLRRCRRSVPQPSDLHPTVQLLFENYGRAECANTGRPLFDDQAWDQARRILNAINAGEVSDPPGISLYFEIGVDLHNLPLYRCCCGTNSLEGGVHQNIIRKFASFNAGPHMTDCMLAEYRLRHNIDVRSTFIGFNGLLTSIPIRRLVQETAMARNISVTMTHG